MGRWTTRLTEKQRVQQNTDPLPNLEQILGMRISELAKRNIALKIYSEVLGCEIWLCGTEEMSNQLTQDNPETTIYTANEMRNLLRLYPTPEVIKRIHNVKSLFNRSRILQTKPTPEDEDVDNND